MKNFLYLLLVLLSSLLYGQKYPPAVVVKNTNDTVKAKIRISTNIFSPDMITESSFYKVVRLVDDNHKKIEKINAKDIKELTFIFNDQKRTYVNGGRKLKEVMYLGKIKWYRIFNQNPYDQSMQYGDEFIDEDGKSYSIGMFGARKATLLKAIKNNPELTQEIKELKAATTEDLINILKKYEY